MLVCRLVKANQSDSPSETERRTHKNTTRNVLVPQGTAKPLSSPLAVEVRRFNLIIGRVGLG